jgi:ankyrin repeat protein
MLEELPETLDKTYERILREINKANREHAHRLLQCLTVAIRPLRITELAEVLAIDFGTADGRELSKLNTDWRWADQEQAVLSTCSSLITVVDEDGDQVIQFSHFSVKEFLTSSRLASSSPDVSRFYILLEPAHTVLAKACLGVLLQLDDRVDKYDVDDRFPLALYAAKHWVNHAQFESVSSQLREGMEILFDQDKPFFSAWIRTYDLDVDSNRGALSRFTILPYFRLPGSPLYYAALCGFYDLSEYLIDSRHQQPNVEGGYLVSPLAAALGTGHFKVAELLYQRGADPLVRGIIGRTMLHAISIEGSIEIAQWLLSHGVGANVQYGDGWAPLHYVVMSGRLDVVQILLQHNADINIRNNYGKTPLHEASLLGHLHVVRLLLQQGSDVNACDNNGFTPLHQASMKGKLDVARLLVEQGANVYAEANNGKTPLQVAEGSDMVKLLADKGFE